MKRETEAQKGPCPGPYILPDSRGPGQEDDSLTSCRLLSEKKEWPRQLPAIPLENATCPSPVHPGRAGRHCGFELSPSAEREGGEAALFEEE